MQATPLTPKVTLWQVQNGNAKDWWMSHLGKDYGPGNYPEIAVDYGKKADFTFTIKQGSANFATNAITIQKGKGKPNGGGGNDKQITITSQTANQLQFSDSNQVQGPLNYILHFSDGSTLDPIIDNGGCCQAEYSFWSKTYMLDGATLGLYLLIAFAVGILAAIGVRALRRG